MVEKQDKDEERADVFLNSLGHGKSMVEIENEEDIDLCEDDDCHDDDCICMEVPCVDADCPCERCH